MSLYHVCPCKVYTKVAHRATAHPTHPPWYHWLRVWKCLDINPHHPTRPFPCTSPHPLRPSPVYQSPPIPTHPLPCISPPPLQSPPTPPALLAVRPNPHPPLPLYHYGSPNDLFCGPLSDPPTAPWHIVWVGLSLLSCGKKLMEVGSATLSLPNWYMALDKALRTVICLLLSISHGRELDCTAKRISSWRVPLISISWRALPTNKSWRSRGSCCSPSDVNDGYLVAGAHAIPYPTKHLSWEWAGCVDWKSREADGWATRLRSRVVSSEVEVKLPAPTWPFRCAPSPNLEPKNAKLLRLPHSLP